MAALVECHNFKLRHCENVFGLPFPPRCDLPMHDRAFEAYTQASSSPLVMKGSTYRCTLSNTFFAVGHMRRMCQKINLILPGRSLALAHTPRQLRERNPEAAPCESSGKLAGKCSKIRSGKVSGRLHRQAAPKYSEEARRDPKRPEKVR